MSMLDGTNKLLIPNIFWFFDFIGGNIFQNRNVSSPAPVTILSPSGLIDKYKTLYVCPVKVAILCIFGYDQIIIWFNEYPWVDTSSLDVFENIKFQTCEPVSNDFTQVFVNTFQNLIHLSAVPPPETNKLCWWGDQAIAFTAA